MLKLWQLKDFDVGGGLAAGVQHGADNDGWIDAQAPGDTHLALVKAQRLAPPFVARNEAQAAWVAEREWWWRTSFDALPAQPGEHVELVFEGLDTFAEVYLNGHCLGRADNMFRTWRFDAAPYLRADGVNQVAIAFAPASRSVAHRSMPLWPIGSERMAASKRNFIRKAQYGWGWDWGPDFPTVGIWKPAKLERWQAARIFDAHLTTLAFSQAQAEVRVDIDVQMPAPAADLVIDVQVLDPQGRSVAHRALACQAALKLDLMLPEPQIWWTADLGAQPLYTLQVRLLRGETELDCRQQRVGLRMIALDTSADAQEPGTDFFRFVLNGVPIFARGANWIPADSFVGGIDERRYHDLLEQAVRANMNMIRVWGGGVYEHEAFYDRCDRLGLLVWQDFMFACAPYPDDDEAFVDNVREEVRQQVRALRHHPSLALWCGNNECQLLHDLIDRMTHTQSPLRGARLYDQVIAEAVAELDPTTPYWPGSPSGGPSPNSMRGGDVHNWTVWHGAPPVPDENFIGGFDRSPAGMAYTRYAEDMARFVSEFGIGAAPELATLKRWMSADDLQLDSPGFLDRIKDEPKDKVNGMLIPVTGLPQTLREYVDFTMFTQAEGLKFGIEHYRRRKPHCSGTLIWQFNDCWPCVSWSLVDYDGVGKASFYTTARAYAPLLVSFKPLAGDQFELWVTNDRLEAVQGDAVVELQMLAGETLWSTTVPFAVPANASQCVWSGSAPTGSTDRVLCVHSPVQQFASNRHLLAPPKDLALDGNAQPQVRIDSISPQELHVELSASAYLLFVHLTSDKTGLHISDNYFDLRAGESRTIVVRSEREPLNATDLEIRCWNRRSH